MNTSIVSRDTAIEAISNRVRGLCSKCNQSDIIDIILDNSITISIEEYSTIIGTLNPILTICKKCLTNGTSRNRTPRKKPTKGKSRK